MYQLHDAVMCWYCVLKLQEYIIYSHKSKALWCNMSVIKQSLIQNAGLGVFAKKNIKKGQIVCYYDGEDIPMNNHVFDAYTMIHPTLPDVCRKGYDKPRNNKGVGQFINDGAMLNWNDYGINNLLTDNLEVNPSGVKHMKKQLQRYNTQSNMNRNAMFIDDNFNIVATKTIKQGEELYFTYGYGYWVDRLQKQTKNNITRMFIDVAFGDLKIGNNECGVKLLQFQNACGKYDEDVDNVIKRYYKLHDESIKCGDMIQAYQTIVKQFNCSKENI